MRRYLHSLVLKHRALDREIGEEARRPGNCPSKLRALKRLRLAIKDRISALQRPLGRLGA